MVVQVVVQSKPANPWKPPPEAPSALRPHLDRVVGVLWAVAHDLRDGRRSRTEGGWTRPKGSDPAEVEEPYRLSISVSQ